MKSIFTLAALLCATWANAQGVYQIPNSDFENWVSDNEPGNGWNSFVSASGIFGGIATNNPQKVSGYNSATAVRLFSVDMGIAKANGNMTTGRINMGSYNPADKSNHNYTDLSSPSYNLQFTGIPDAVSCMAKFKSGGSPNGRGQFILHDKYTYKDPETSNDAGYESHKIALATILIEETADWKYFEGKFNYNDNTTPAVEQYMLASFTTNPVPGGTANDELIIDDVRLIYYSDLSSLSYDGKEYFNSDNTNYTIDAVYDASKLNCTSNGKGATIEKVYDRKTGVLTITVKGNDFSEDPTNVHTYTVQFKKPKSVTSYSNSLLVNAFGSYAAPTQNDIYLIQEADDSYSFLLEDFIFNKVSMGNIEVLNLKHENVNNAVVYSAENQMVYIQGLGTTLPVSLEATQKGEDLTADIHIVMGQDAEVAVTFLPSLILSGQDEVEAVSNRYNVTLSRTFVKGWNTICLPYTTTTVALGAKSVQEFVSVDESGLNFSEVETLEANKPYLIYFDKDITTPVYTVAEITSTTPVSVTKGDYTFVGSYDAVMSMSGKYGVATIDDVQKVILGGKNATLKATRAYFTKTGELPAQVRINLFGEGGNGTTGIDQMENNGVQAYDVYTLQGVQVLKGASSLNGLQKGIYIVNGKKVVIK